MESTRRDFVKQAVAGSIGLGLAGRTAGQRLPIAFSTLGCPSWKWAQILAYANEHAFAAIELRGLEGNLDLPTHPVFAGSAIAGTRRQITDHALHIACVSSSARMDSADAATRSKEMADAKRFIDLAAELQCPYVRVFGTDSDSDKSVAPGDAVRARIAASLRDLGDYAGPRRVTVLIESHDNLVTSPVLNDVLSRAASENVALLWDAHHTFADGKEEPETTVQQLRNWIRHTHLKDSVLSGTERRYVLTGRGDVPIRRQVAALQKMAYSGYYCFEWEKVWHPELENPEIAIGDYAKWMAEYLQPSEWQ